MPYNSRTNKGTSMTVEELIKILEQYPKTAKVEVDCGYRTKPVVEFWFEKVVISAEQD